MDFHKRADLSEWMDEPCSYQDFRDCLRDLGQVNRLTFAYRPTLQWLSRLSLSADGATHIVDVGCGGGDMLRRIEQWAHRKNIPVRLTGIDLNPYAARAAQTFTRKDSQIQWVTGDTFAYSEAPIDVVVSSLFTHHLTDEGIVHFIRWMEKSARLGWFINDLHRERLPYYAFQALATVMRWHRFVRHDGPISIRRSFRSADWESYLASADLPAGTADLLTFRPARLCVSRVKA